MSYILDALRKSERERQQNEPLVLNPIGADAVDMPRRRFNAVVGLTVLALGGVGLGAYWVFVARTPQATTPVSSPVAASPAALPARQAPLAAAGLSRKEAPTPQVRIAPALKPSPFASSRSRATVRDLAKEARVEAPAPAPPRAVERTAVPVVAVAPAPAANSVKFLRSMPPEFQRAIPDLTVTIHIYATREADRILYINNRQYHAGDHIRGDIVVEDIVQDGAILSYHGTRFKLPRPT